MRRLGTILAILALTGGVIACGGTGKEQAAPPLPDTFAILGTSRQSNPFGDAGFTSGELPRNAVLAGTEYTVKLSRYGVTAELSERAIDDLRLRGETRPAPWRAGPGREFLMVHLADPEDGRIPAPDRFPTVSVLVDGQTRALDRMAVLPYTIIVMSVPAGADATLAVTEGSHTQSVSIRTGTVVGAPSATPTPSPSPPPMSGPVVSGKVRLQDYVAVPGHGPGLGWDALMYVEVEVELLAYDDKRGPAPAGKLWAHVEVELTGNPTYAKFTVDVPRSLTIRTASGQALRAPAGTSLIMPKVYLAPGSVVPDPTMLVPDTWSGVFEVPAKTRKLSVTYRTRGTAVDNKGRKVTFTRRDVRNSGTIALK